MNGFGNIVIELSRKSGRLDDSIWVAIQVEDTTVHPCFIAGLVEHGNVWIHVSIAALIVGVTELVSVSFDKCGITIDWKVRYRPIL